MSFFFFAASVALVLWAVVHAAKCIIGYERAAAAAWSKYRASLSPAERQREDEHIEVICAIASARRKEAAPTPHPKPLLQQPTIMTMRPHAVRTLPLRRPVLR